ncbi:hypothetical protein, unlikely [Trypanosoma brucei gambiense DAL972]|uniref:Uncharacterized protein n=1 Tax=Trypanosoma brucei gambiense (strain MHOM/CI/86/DAL972) TaxID=679716 RepID=C9ZMH7_TRYB9|nr:hypothetical protein, unlikely [Trypanosoma brucei gambiense DAL972]CBH10851.1 hypothetical protein, unlikely [Trypanosoma brucei gambiense DAL972]|eukprot:XP_011773138.1 hypothetical protein, unlikely [Trypanosoma brucei gambiense DAL972]
MGSDTSVSLYIKVPRRCGGDMLTSVHTFHKCFFFFSIGPFIQSSIRKRGKDEDEDEERKKKRKEKKEKRKKNRGRWEEKRQQTGEWRVTSFKQIKFSFLILFCVFVFVFVFVFKTVINTFSLLYSSFLLYFILVLLPTIFTTVKRRTHTHKQKKKRKEKETRGGIYFPLSLQLRTGGANKAKKK